MDYKEYKAKMKSLPFADRMVEYFSISAVYDKEPDEMKKLIRETFTKKEEAEYYTTYSPIMIAIEQYNDRVRTLKINADYFTYYITSQLRRRDNLERVTGFLNKVIDTAKRYKKEDIQGESTEEMIDSLLSMLTHYKELDIERNISVIYEEEKGYYLDESKMNENIKKATASLKNILSALKSYVLSAREFLEVIQKPELFPREFKDAEKWMQYFFINRMEITDTENMGEGEKDFLTLDYNDIECTDKIFGEGNLWLKAYYSNIR